MSTTGDERAGRAIRRALEAGPRDVIDLVGAVRAAEPALVAHQEGALHAVLLREVRAGRVVFGSRSSRGLTRYRLRDTEDGQDAEAPALPGPLEPAVADAALRVAAAVRDPATRGRVQAEVIAHLDALTAAGQVGRFGSVRAARHLLQRVARGRSAVCLAASGGDHVRRFLLHEGPWLAGAVILFFLLQAFVVQVFQIPSSSMVPTLEVGDRVVVFKLGAGGTPERWAVVTFDRADTTYVKRVVGLPGESIELRHGDVYVGGTLLVKPDAVREALRSPVGSWDFDDEKPKGWTYSTDAVGTRIWRHAADFSPHPEGMRGNRFALRDGYLVLDAAREGVGRVSLILERGPGPGSAGLSRAWHLDLDVQGVALSEVERRDEVEVERRLLAEDARATAPGRVRLALSYVDGVLRASAGTWSYEGARAAPDEALRPRVEAYGAGARPLRLALDRDLHYAQLGTHGVPTGPDEPPNAHAIPPGRLFVMGDNTTNSTDSRFSEVGDIPVEDVIGPVSVRIWPPSRLGAVR